MLNTAVPAHESLPDLLAEDLARLDAMDDARLWQAARSRLSKKDATQLEVLHLKRQKEGLSESETPELAELVEQYERSMFDSRPCSSPIEPAGLRPLGLNCQAMSRSRISKALRVRVVAQARHRCGYCLTAESIVGMPMELDHLIPESLGGLTEEDNLWLACSLCNDSKNCRIAFEDPASGEVVRLFNPRHQDWHEHFR